MPESIHIGFEAGSGRAVKMREHHTVVSGQTQMSGKTTTIKALITRSDRKALIFVTKRGEIGFTGYNVVQPYFKEQTGWRYIKSLLEAQEQRRMVFNEPWIIKACQGVRTLRGVLENTERLREKARRDFDKDQYLVLIEYLKVVVPAVESKPWARSLPLVKGINIMDLVDMPEQMQALVIQSTLDYIMDRMKGVIAVIPEAWKFVPKSGNPVKLAAESYIRQGAAIGNYLWIDSQDLAGVDTAILKQCNNWLMGFQRELNEAERVAKTAGHKVSTAIIQGLKLGHFVASLGVDEPRVVYVWPEGVPMQMAIDVAMGLLRPEDVKRYMEKGEDDLVWKERYEDSQRELATLQEKLTALESQRPTAPSDVVEQMQRRIDALGEAVGVEMGAKAKAEDQAKQYMDLAVTLRDERDKLKGSVENLMEENAALERADRLLQVFREVMADAVPVQPTVILDRDEAGYAAPIPIVNIPEIVDQVVARFREMPQVQVVTVNVDEAAKAALLDAEYRDIMAAASRLGDKARMLALTMRERGEMRTLDLYYLVSGKSTGRPSGDFYPNLKALTEAHLVDNTGGQVKWSLPAYLQGRFPWLNAEQVKQLTDNTAAQLLPPAP